MSLENAYNEEKNELLKKTRKVSFEDVIESLKKGDCLDVLKHPSHEKHADQRILVVKIKEYAYAVPYVVDRKRKRFFFKTIYPNRKLRKRYLNKQYEK